MNLKMNNFDKVKRDALNELNAEQSQQLIKANTLQILGNIFTDEMDENKLNELSKRQIDLVNFYYDKGYHFEMMHGIISGCYEKICDLYAENVMHDFQLLMNDFEHKVNVYVLQTNYLQSAKLNDVDENMMKICMGNITKKQAGEIRKLHKNLISMIEFVGVDSSQVDVLFNQFIDAEKYVESVKTN